MIISLNLPKPKNVLTGRWLFDDITYQITETCYQGRGLCLTDPYKKCLANSSGRNRHIDSQSYLLPKEKNYLKRKAKPQFTDLPKLEKSLDWKVTF